MCLQEESQSFEEAYGIEAESKVAIFGEDVIEAAFMLFDKIFEVIIKGKMEMSLSF